MCPGQPAVLCLTERSRCRPVGLVKAIQLQQHGAKVSVYERSNSPRVSGCTLVAHSDSGQLAIKVAGLRLFDPFCKHARPTAERMADKCGNIEQEEHIPEDAEAAWARTQRLTVQLSMKC